jgi:hypothetical protein
MNNFELFRNTILGLNELREKAEKIEHEDLLNDHLYDLPLDILGFPEDSDEFCRDGLNSTIQDSLDTGESIEKIYNILINIKKDLSKK